MKVESTKYYCDVCGKEVESNDYLTGVVIPIRYLQSSDYQGFGYFDEKPHRQSLEICDECLEALRKAISKNFADMYAQSYTNEIAIKLKYKKGAKDEE